MTKTLIAITVALALLFAYGGHADTYPNSTYTSCTGFCITATNLDPADQYIVSFKYRSDDGTVQRNGTIGYDDQSNPDPYGSVTFGVPISSLLRIARGTTGTLTAWIREADEPWGAPPIETTLGPAVTTTRIP